MPRLGHKKSRNGCRQCKARHVKCDESKPCSSCARHGVQCSLVTWDPNAPPPTPIKREVGDAPNSSRVSKSIPERPRKQSSTQAPTLSSTSLPIDYVLNPSPVPTPGSSEGGSPYSPNDTYPFLTRFAHKSDTSHSNYWVRDLELMHHWTIETFYFLAGKEQVRDFWRVEAPKQAINHPFLLHEILAISALHKAYLEPDQRQAYYALGIHHQDLAIGELRKTLPNLAPDNAGAMFATSAVLSLTAYAATGLGVQDPNTKQKPAIDDLLDIFALTQGMYSILSQNHAHVLAGPFAILLGDAQINSEEPGQPILLSISAQIPTLTSFIESQALPSPVRVTVFEALACLKSCLDFSNAPRASTRELRFLFSWPNYLTQNFCCMLRRKESPALVVLAYYAVAFRGANFYWFLEGWAERIIKAIVEAVEPSWQPILQWPWDFIMNGGQLGQEQGHISHQHTIQQPPHVPGIIQTSCPGTQQQQHTQDQNTL